MDLARLADLLQDASPWVVLAITVIAVIYRVLSHRERLRGRSELQALIEQLDKMSRDAAGVRAICDETREMLSLQDGGQTRSLLEKIAQELVNLNAASGVVITMENAKLIIGYQWNWCREETVRLLVNSIDNNHFIGNESITTRRIFRAWKQASQNAKASVDKFSGIRYPYKSLFDNHIQLVWETLWGWAIPLYHGDFQERDVAIEDLRGRARLLCEDVLDGYYKAVEDIDEGTLYAATDSSVLIKEGYPVGSEGYEQLVKKMGKKLKNYEKHGSDDGGSGGYSTVETKEAVRERHRRECDSTG